MFEVLFLICALESEDCTVVPFAYFNGSAEECAAAVREVAPTLDEQLAAHGVEIRGFKCVPTSKESNT